MTSRRLIASPKTPRQSIVSAPLALWKRPNDAGGYAPLWVKIGKSQIKDSYAASPSKADTA